MNDPSSHKNNVSGKIHLRPRLQEMLQSLHLDITYERAIGDYLYYQDEDGEEVKVLDLVGGYGSLLLGHSHPDLIAQAQVLLSECRPIHTQGSNRHYAQRLASELSRRAQADYSVIFGNSGAEAVEVAMKHAMLQTGGKTFITLEGGFHGKTLGALQLTHNEFYRGEFSVSGIKVLRVPANDQQALELAFDQAGSELAGFIFEPVLGEGGVHKLSAEFVQHAAALCQKQNVALIADECQTGLGRTGYFLASESLGVEPDLIVLSKILGGGLVKISACLIKQSKYIDRFDLRHTSTFADDDYSSAIALKTLELIDDDLLLGVRRKGEGILKKLEGIKDRFPDIIKGVRGSGLMLGIEFKAIDRLDKGFLLRFLSSQDDLTKWIAGYLLNEHRVRVLPMLSSPFTLRLQPSSMISDTDIAQMIHALEDVCFRIQTNDIVGLSRFLMSSKAVEKSVTELVIPRESPKFFAYRSDRFWKGEKDSRKPRVAWLCHLIDTHDFVTLEPGMANVDAEKCEALLARGASHAGPIVMSTVDIKSPARGEVKLYSILLPVTSSWFKARMDAGEFGLARALVQQGVDLANSLGCDVTSLGQYTSIVTANGMRIDSGGMTMTSGNSYTVALAVDAVKRAMEVKGIDPSKATLAVVGAAGNIGRTCAAILAPEFRKTNLIGCDNPGAKIRMQRIAEQFPGKDITCCASLSSVRDAQVVISAPNAVEPILKASHFSRNAVVCDLSVPTSIQPGVGRERRDVIIVKGGVAQLPFREDIELPGKHLPTGQTFACMAEGILLGMEGASGSAFTGTLNPKCVGQVRDMAEHHQFKLADYKTNCVLGSDKNEYASNMSTTVA